MSSRAESSPAPSLAGHLQAFLISLDAECGLATNTIRSYRGDLQDFLGWLGNRKSQSLADVDVELLTEFLQPLRDRQLATASLARRLSAIRTFFRFLVYDGVLTETHIEQFRSPRQWQRLPKVLSPEVIDRLIAEPGHDGLDRFPLRDRSLLGLLYATGCRASEVIGLTLRDVHLDEGFCRCLGK